MKGLIACQAMDDVIGMRPGISTSMPREINLIAERDQNTVVDLVRIWP